MGLEHLGKKDSRSGFRKHSEKNSLKIISGRTKLGFKNVGRRKKIRLQNLRKLKIQVKQMQFTKKQVKNIQVTKN